MHYSTFLLDLDHTLFDSDTSEAAAFTQTMCVAGVAEPERYVGSYQKINLGLWAQVARGELTPQQVRTLRFERLVEETDIAADPRQMSDEFVAGLAENGELYDDALDMLELLSRSAALALVTNGLAEVQRRRIERLGIDAYFDAIVISAEVGTAKPKPEIFDIAFKELESPARDSALMVGDSLSCDMRGGANYGIATCWYNPSQSTGQRTHHVVHEIARLDELSRFIAP